MARDLATLVSDPRREISEKLVPFAQPFTGAAKKDKGLLRELVPPVDQGVRVVENLGAGGEKRERELLKQLTGVRTGVDYEAEEQDKRRRRRW